MEKLQHHKTSVESYCDVLDRIVPALLQPDLKIGLGSGKIIDLLVEWLMARARTPECSTMSVFCAEKNQAGWLMKSGINARYDVPEESGDMMHQLDYFFEMADYMTKDFGFVQTNPYCEVRKNLFKKAKQCVFFYHYKDSVRHPPVEKIPIEIATVYDAPSIRYLNTGTTYLEESVPWLDGDTLTRVFWKLRPRDPKLGPGKDLGGYTRALRGVHGIVAHGYYSKVHGYLVEMSELGIYTMHMTVTPLNWAMNCIP